jgi:hypothetical protein
MAARRSRTVELYHDEMAETGRLPYSEVRTNADILAAPGITIAERTSFSSASNYVNGKQVVILKAQSREYINGRQKIKAFEK